MNRARRPALAVRPARSGCLLESLDSRAPARPDYHVMTQPFVTFAVAGGQNVVDALRNHAA